MLVIISCRNSSWWGGGLETLILGGACATVAYTIGNAVNALVDHDDE